MNLPRTVVLSLLIVFPGCEGRQPGLRWMVPEQLNGCISTTFQVKGAPPLPMKDGWYVIQLPAEAGSLQTSSEPQWGEGLRTEYWQQKGDSLQRIEPSCDGARITHVKEGWMELRDCFGEVSKMDCLKAKGGVPK
ncbi:hypothetical protein ACLESD_15650 [Pyxidicoccus sp. 3LFB2]